MEHLIANTGIQFVTREVEFNPNEQFLLPDGKSLKYTFLEYIDELFNVQIFDALCVNMGNYIPLGELRKGNGCVLRPDGYEDLDIYGLPKISQDVNPAHFSSFRAGDQSVFSITTLGAYTVNDPNDKYSKVSAFELLLDKWLPMPMFEKSDDGFTTNQPLAWCRVKIEYVGTGSVKGCNRYRFNWAFDTELATDLSAVSRLRPYFMFGESDSKVYGLCSCISGLFDFVSSDGEGFSAFSEYIFNVLGCPRDQFSNKYIAYYMYLINFLRLCGASPEVTLHNNALKDINVDLVLDIGNSRTCGVLFENGEFTKGQMLGLRDLTHPDVVYDKSFDMRFVFRQADFGNDIVLPEDVFKWYSLVRVGDEAKHLVYRSVEQDCLSSLETNYSSPKRYLWDLKPFEGHWENLIKEEDSFSAKQGKNVYTPKLSEMFDPFGNYIPDGSNVSYDMFAPLNYSRSSLMTFVLIEIFQQAISQINSFQFRVHHGNVDRRRVLRNVILTCPTAMPLVEQKKLRKCAEEAMSAICRCIPQMKMANIVPSSSDSGKVWSFDEASCSQLTYLYAEIGQRYKGAVKKFFEMKGHVRKEDAEAGNREKSLTIGSVDIGAGTTDVMICSYQCQGKNVNRLIPTPLYWDSSYLAGDDILRNVIQNLIIEGYEHSATNIGNIRSALIARLMQMSDKELYNIPSVGKNHVYESMVNNICMSIDEVTKTSHKKTFANNLMHDFFGNDSAGMSHKARRCRLEFNTQISVPIAQMYLDLLRMKRPTKVYSFDEVFSSNKPASHLLAYFEEHFGFRFEELSWRFDPLELENIVKTTLEPLMKQLAVLLYSYHCDIIVLAGRPTSLDAITELFVKYLPTTPDNLVRLNEYHVGNWFPTATGEGYFYDQKSIVAVGAMVGYLANKGLLNDFTIDFNDMGQKMYSTAKYIGEFNPSFSQVKESFLSPVKSMATIVVPAFPVFIGCKQFDSPLYQARPLYAIYSKENSLKLTISRDYLQDREILHLEDIQDENGEQLPLDRVELVQQSIVEDGKYWMDKGAFTLSIN